LEIQLSRGESWDPIVIGDSIIKRGELGTYCDWRFNYQEGRVGILLSLEIQLSRGEMLGSYCHWRFNYQEGRCWNPIVIGDSIIKRGVVGNLLSLEIQLSRGEILKSYCHWRFNYQEGRCWDPIVIGDSIIKRGELESYCDWRFNYQEGRVGILLSLEIQLSRGEMLGSYGD
jgi:hypothetical protein